MKGILGPLMPPWSLIILKYASSVRSIAPYAPAGPSCGPQLPTTTSVSVTPVTTGLAVAGADAAAGWGGARPPGRARPDARYQASPAPPCNKKAWLHDKYPFLQAAAS